MPDKPKDLPSITYWYEKKDGRVIFCYTFTEEHYEARNHPSEVVQFDGMEQIIRR